MSEAKSRQVSSEKYFGVKLRAKRQAVEAKASLKKNDYKIGDIVIVQMPERIEDGQILYVVEKKEKTKDKLKLLRKASKDDLEKIEQTLKEELKASKIFTQKVKKHKLNMKLIKAEISFDQKYITFYFAADTRLDFRELLRDLVKTFHKMIRLQQIGPRDEAKMISGLGPCGRELCCRRFLKKLESVPSDLAKVQRLSHVSSSKISGVCGKLMCCLAFEAEMYRKLSKNLPKVGETINTKHGKGKVVEQDVLGQKVKVKLASGEQALLSVKKSAA